MSLVLIGFVIVTWLVSVEVILTFSHAKTFPVEKALIRDLLKRYNKEGQAGRPVVHPSDKIVVNFSVSLIQIMDVDEKNQVLKTNIWYHYKWPDFLLQWNHSLHDNITSIRVPPDKIWLPDIVLYNFADNRLTEQRDALVVVGHTGELQWMPQAILNSSCFFDTLFFPFDEHICHFKFGSWSYNGDMLDIDFIGEDRHMDMSDYIESTEWDITENTAVKNTKYYTCCPEPYTDMTFTLKFKRRVAFYTFILILPCSLLSLLTLVIFWVPPESPAKLQLGMNIFLAFFVLLLLLSDYTPRAATSIPLIGAYFCLSMILITMSTVFACTVANMYFRGVRIARAPRWLRSCVIESAAQWLCVHEVIEESRYQPVTPRKTWSTYVTGEQSHSDPETLVAKTHLLNCPTGSRQDIRDYGAFRDVTRELCEPSTSSSLPSLALPSPAEETVLLEEVSSVREMMEENLWVSDTVEVYNKQVREWRMIACVMDRILFTSYIGVNVLGIVVILMRSYLL
ncbi:neuronal acetylcholine receptor subunit alpha-2 [Biomphalaria glabrata]|uniref:Neuronal acetylcholine receptor subunit alpha-2-like isoform X2 n=1 Tax=Biomphalaria glabrata TaxID=6526 RepID=A0A9W2ZP09_BIOGL|nr:neuronal acetylcholine receptor subunit alpha-2-like isoform X2 [Biomphalaria glabrata]XP_055876705.1 neuronal acetylcholine receptor subunit alpha-2-like isoform X2 [Biomphalaria glabrata]KAI8765311.1 neuronal acetylcholine receptor subunit alpha-2-like [Biomphalaria glabrata]